MARKDKLGTQYMQARGLTGEGEAVLPAARDLHDADAGREGHTAGHRHNLLIQTAPLVHYTIRCNTRARHAREMRPRRTQNTRTLQMESQLSSPNVTGYILYYDIK